MGEPKLRFKADDGSEFPAWEKKTLGDLGVFVRGLTYDKTQTVETNGVAVMRSNNISSDGTLDYENGVQLVSKEPSEEQLLRKNDIVICMANGSDRLVGKAAKYDGRYKEPSRITVGAFCGIFRSSAPALPWWFQSDEYQRFLYLGKQGGNGALANLKGKDIENISVMFPADIDEQRKISDFLSAVDAVIAAQQAEVDAWKQRKKGVMQKLFSQEVRFKADDGSEFPDWEEKTLGELCAPLTYGMNAAATKFDGENRYIRITDIDDETHVLLPNDIVSPSGELDDKYLVKKGDILLARTGASTGKSYLYHPKDGKLFYAGFLIKAHVLPSSDDYFIYSQTLTDRYWKWVKTASMRSGQPGINANEYASYSFAVPSLPEQRKIADCLSSMDEVIQKAKDELAKWRELKKGLLQQMFV